MFTCKLVYFYKKKPNDYFSKEGEYLMTSFFYVSDAPWIIRMEKGQKISVTLYDFALKLINSSGADVVSGTPNSKICRVYATIREATNTRSITVCGGNSRVRHVYTSVTNQVELRILNSKTPHDPLYFLFKYQGTFPKQEPILVYMLNYIFVKRSPHF